MVLMVIMMMLITDDENFDAIDFLRKPIFNNTEIPVPHCSETYPAQPLVGEVCNVNEVFLFYMIMIIYYENDNV